MAHSKEVLAKILNSVSDNDYLDSLAITELLIHLSEVSSEPFDVELLSEVDWQSKTSIINTWPYEKF